MGTVIDVKLNLKNMCKKANQKLSALSRISKWAILNKWEKMINSFSSSEFPDCLLIGVFTSKSCNKKESIEHMKDCSRST